jgi:hypothetical protein
MKCDWALNGYALFVIGSILYYIEAIAPYIPDSTSDDAAEIYYDGVLYEDKASAKMDLTACVIFLVESIIYIVGWHLGRRELRREALQLRPYHEDWNFWGNWLFFFGSIIYQIISVMQYNGLEEYVCNVLNLFNSLLFLLDSVLYTFAMFHGECSRAPSNISSDGKWSFRSQVDWYMLACLLFVVGSFVYVVAAMQTMQNESAIFWNLLGAIIFLVDAALYIASAFHYRNEDMEGDIADRRYLWWIEHVADTTPTGTQRRSTYILCLPDNSDLFKTTQIHTTSSNNPLHLDDAL